MPNVRNERVRANSSRYGWVGLTYLLLSVALLAWLLVRASARTQIILVSHSERLIQGLRRDGRIEEIRLAKQLGETRAEDADPPLWVWPKR
ncbi:hypothetical protein [Sphingobium sp. AP50]|uniref:hypothetical protein n=1 Tax=Sphingobium sp. AP50 TaxID=1884369 RepID=UPI0011602492|nr:hypothetical protein [Sphingobium sp. AP50]